MKVFSSLKFNLLSTIKILAFVLSANSLQAPLMLDSLLRPDTPLERVWKRAIVGIYETNAPTYNYEKIKAKFGFYNFYKVEADLNRVIKIMQATENVSELKIACLEFLAKKKVLQNPFEAVVEDVVEDVEENIDFEGFPEEFKQEAVYLLENLKLVRSSANILWMNNFVAKFKEAMVQYLIELFKLFPDHRFTRALTRLCVFSLCQTEATSHIIFQMEQNLENPASIHPLITDIINSIAQNWNNLILFSKKLSDMGRFS